MEKIGRKLEKGEFYGMKMISIKLFKIDILVYKKLKKKELPTFCMVLSLLGHI